MPGPRKSGDLTGALAAMRADMGRSGTRCAAPDLETAEDGGSGGLRQVSSARRDGPVIECGCELVGESGGGDGKGSSLHLHQR